MCRLTFFRVQENKYEIILDAYNSTLALIRASANNKTGRRGITISIDRCETSRALSKTKSYLATKKQFQIERIWECSERIYSASVSFYVTRQSMKTCAKCNVTMYLRVLLVYSIQQIFVASSIILDVTRAKRIPFWAFGNDSRKRIRSSVRICKRKLWEIFFDKQKKSSSRMDSCKIPWCGIHSCRIRDVGVRACRVCVTDSRHDCRKSLFFLAYLRTRHIEFAYTHTHICSCMYVRALD